MDAQTPDTLVIGAGISGLILAWRLKKKGHRVTVLEAAPRPGGSIGSGRIDGMLWESGPNSGLDTTPLINEMLADLGILEQRINARSVANRRYIVRNGTLNMLPMSPPAFFASKLFSTRTKLGLVREPFIPRSAPELEESVSDFVRRRLGQEFLDYAIEPFVAGIFAGNPDILAVKAAFPKLHTLEQKHGGLIRGMIFGAKERHKRKEKSKNDARSFSFKDGLQTLTDTLATAVGQVETGVRVTRIAQEADGRWRVEGEHADGPIVRHAHTVALAAPADTAANLLAPFSEDAAAALRDIPYSPVVSIVTAWKRDSIDGSVDGFGFLIPRKENTQTLGTLFSSSMFDYRADPEYAVLTTFIGGMRQPDNALTDDETLVSMLNGDLSRLIGVSGDPLWMKINRHPRAIPQYTMGHLSRLERTEAARKNLPGLFFCANWRGGIAIGDCVKNAHLAADEIHGFIEKTV